MRRKSPAGLVLAGLFACAAASGRAGTTVTAAGGLIPWKGVTGESNLAARTCFEEFLRNHPGVEIVAFDQLRLPGVHASAAQVMSIAGTAGPEALIVPFGELGGYVREGLIQPVDDLVAAWAGRDRWPAALAADLRLEDRRWGAVTDAAYAVLAGNRAVFAESGLTAADLPRTWDDLVVLAARLTSPGKRAGFGLVGNRSLACLWLGLVRQAGGDGTVVLGREGVAANLLDEPSRRAASFIARIGLQLRSAGTGVFTVTGTGKELRNLAREGRVAFALTTDRDAVVTWEDGHRYMFEQEPLLGPVPGAFAADPLAYVEEGYLAVIPRFVRDPGRRRLIWEFHTTGSWASPDLERKWLDLAAASRTWRVPPIYAIRFPGHPATAGLPPDWAATLQAVLPRARPMPPDREFERLAEILGARLTVLLERGGDPVAALRAAQEEFSSTVHPESRRASAAWKAATWGVLGAFALAFALGLFRLAGALREEFRAVRSVPSRSFHPLRRTFAALMFAPAVILALVFGVAPLLEGLRMSLHSHVLRDGGSFAGMDNYLDVLVSPTTHLAGLNTLYFLLISFFLGFVAPLVLAVVLAGLPWMRLLIRSVFFLPAVASAVVVAMLWQQMYGGPFNQLVAALGFAPRNWLGDPGIAMFSTVLALSWSTLGVNGLVYLAGLGSIPEELYEDAEIQGAGVTDRFAAVTLPHLLPVIGIAFVGWLIAAARTTEHVFLMTGGGPEKATYVLGLDIFTQAYVSIRFGYAMAEVWLVVAVILVLSIYQMRAVRRGQARLLLE